MVKLNVDCNAHSEPSQNEDRVSQQFCPHIILRRCLYAVGVLCRRHTMVRFHQFLSGKKANLQIKNVFFNIF